jgi:calcineurin-like phosphoesterase family protein
MCAATYFVGDLHLGHEGMVRFTDKDGKKIRPYATIQEHDEALIKNINSVVKPEDRLYFLGDVVINRRCLPQIGRINGRKKLIKGNHDIFKLEDYMPYFEDISAYRIYPKMGVIMSHIPVHPNQLEHRFKFNVHGHLHSNLVLGGKHAMQPDNRYINICPEHTKFMPVSMDEIIQKIGYDKHANQMLP